MAVNIPINMTIAMEVQSIALCQGLMTIRSKNRPRESFTVLATVIPTVCAIVVIFMVWTVSSGDSRSMCDPMPAFAATVQTAAKVTLRSCDNPRVNYLSHV